MPFWDAWRNRNKKNASSERKLSPLLDVGFHGDSYLLELVASFTPHVTHFVETGANVGTTTRYMAATYPQLKIYSCEPDKKAYEKALEATEPYRARVTLYNELSPQFLHTLYKAHPALREHTNLYWLDAHGYGYRWPLHDELQFITQQNEAGIIMIDDSQIPNQPQFTFSAYDNQVCDNDYIRNGLSAGKRYQLIYPTYTEHTSPHHPLVGVTTIIFGATLIGKIAIKEHFTSEIVDK